MTKSIQVMGTAYGAEEVGEARMEFSETFTESLGIERDKQYRLYAEEVQEPEYPRYFIKPLTSRYSYWRFDNKIQRFEVNLAGYESPCFLTLKFFEEHAQEVTKEQAEAYIRAGPEYPRYFIKDGWAYYWRVDSPTIRSCVSRDGTISCAYPGLDWLQKYAREVTKEQAACLRDGFGISAGIGYLWCPFCGLGIEVEQPEPQSPEGYREPAEDEKAIAEPPEDTWWWDIDEMQYERWGFFHSWPRKLRKRQASIIVPASWSPMPECRDCEDGALTRFSKWNASGEIEVECSRKPYNHTRGPYKPSKVEAVKAYPRKGK